MEAGDFYERLFQECFRCLDRSKGDTNCFICSRSSDEVYETMKKRYEEVYKDDKDGLKQMLELIDSQEFSFVTFRTVRPLCLICYWNLGEAELVDTLINEVRTKGEDLWPDPHEQS